MHIFSGEEGISNHPLTSFLEASTKRWRTLTCGLPTWSLQLFSGCSFPSLQELGIRYQDTAGNTDTSVDAFNNAPCLKTLNLYSSSGEGESYQMFESFPCHQLAHMSCYAFSLEFPVRSLLERSISMENLTLWFGQTLFELEPGDKITLPALKRIDLIEHSGGDAGTVADLLRVLRLPRIRELSLAFTDHYICFENLEAHPDFHQITALRIEGAMLRMPDPDYEYVQRGYIGGTETLLNFLDLMTGVEEFQLEDRKLSGDFLIGLVAGAAEDGTVRLPCLRTVDLHESGFDSDTDHVMDLLLNVVNSRSVVRSALESPCSALQKLVVPEKWNSIENLESISSWSTISDSVEVVFR